MAAIITIATSKGGGGKTTLASALASHWAAEGRRLTVIDADRNGTFARWAASYYEGPAFPTVTELDHTAVGRVARRAAADGLVVIDTAGFENQTAGLAMACADLVLIPCMPDRGSTHEAARTARTAEALWESSGRTPLMRIVLSRWNPRGLAERAALEDIAAEGLRPLVATMPPLSDFAKVTFSGRLEASSRAASSVRLVALEIDRTLSPRRRRVA
jgi:chromosome partitioning protein